MTAPDPFPAPDPGLDAVVRAQLDAEAARIDPRPLAARVLGRLAAEAGAQPARPRRRWHRAAVWGGAAALAAAVLVAGFVVPAPRDAAASPAEVVRAARDSSGAAETRRYRVRLELSPGGREAFPVLALDRRPRTLCTRGDRFVVEPGFGGTGAWGRDATGRVWFAPTPEGAAAYDESELPQPLRAALTVHELQLTPLLDEVLVDFELAWSGPPAPGSDTYSVAATRRGPVPPLRLASAELVIDRDTKAVRTLTLRRRGLSDSAATLTFSLLPAGACEDAAFTPEGHLRPGAPVFDRSRPVLRRLLIVKHLGDKLADGI